MCLNTSKTRYRVIQAYESGNCNNNTNTKITRQSIHTLKTGLQPGWVNLKKTPDQIHLHRLLYIRILYRII